MGYRLCIHIIFYRLYPFVQNRTAWFYKKQNQYKRLQQTSVQQTMQVTQSSIKQTLRNYIKLTFCKVEFAKHIQFEATKPKQPNLQFIIKASLIDEKANQICKVGQLKFIQFYTENGSVFYLKSQKWDCLEIFSEEKELKGKLKLRLSFKVQNNHSKANNKRENSNQQIQTKPQEENKSGQQSVQDLQLNSLIKILKQKIFSQADILPVELPPIDISLDHVIRSPYIIHSMNLDFRFPSQKQIYFQKNSGTERDGMLTIQISFLNKLGVQLLVKNVRLKTKIFSKNYKFIVCQQFEERTRNDLKRSRIYEEIIKPDSKGYKKKTHLNKRALEGQGQTKQKSDSIQFDLTPSKWQQFQCEQSIDKQKALPLKLLNELDQIRFLFQYENQQNSASPGKRNSTIKPETRIVNICTFECTIKLDALLGKRFSNKQWTPEKLVFNNYEIFFDFKLQTKKKSQEESFEMVDGSDFKAD